MSEFVSTVFTLFQPLAMAVALVYAYSLITRWRSNRWVVSILTGLLFGLATLFSIASPIDMGGGYIVDQRNLLIFVSGAFFGPLAGGITVAMGIVMRIEVGGAGTGVGAISMLVSYGTALAWFYLAPRMENFRFWPMSVMGLVCSSHLIVSALLPDGVWQPFLFELAPLIAVGNLLGTLLLSSLILREHRLQIEEDRLQEAAMLDPLTRLLNRRSLIEAVEAPDQRPHLGRAMFYFDIDNFKALNDTHGHAVGDSILQIVTTRVRDCLRPNDLFSRIGGDEFVVVLPNVTQEVARTVAERCHAVVSRDPILLDEKMLDVTISLGASWAEVPPEFEEHLILADTALYSAKTAGRDRIRFDAADREMADGRSNVTDITAEEHAPGAATAA